MPDYVAFLRAINLGKNRKFPMAELRACLETAGFDQVETYIQTGNVRLASPLRSPVRLGEALEEIFEADRGFTVQTVVMTTKELRQVHDDAVGLVPPLDHPAEELRRYVTLVKDTPAPEAVAQVEALSHETEAAVVRGRAVHLWVHSGYQNARINNARVEKLLGAATTRDLKVITTLAERWGA